MMTSGRSRPSILVAGHDLKFATGPIAALRDRGYQVAVDQWRGHNEHDERESKRLLAQADLVWAEWCLGNAVWYSKRISRRQRLVVRFHAHELRQRYAREVRVSRVDRFVFVADHVRELATKAFGFDAYQTCVVPNAVDCALFDRPKRPGAELNLGLLGFCPSSKGLHRALDTLELLRAREQGYRLHVKGSMPKEHNWIWRQPAERAYYEEQFARIEATPALAGAVEFHPHGPDVPEWFEQIGVVLSPSEHESWHLAVAEGAASGALPVVWAREGAAAVHSRDWIVADADAAAARISARRGDDPELKELVRTRYDVGIVVDQLEQLFDRVRAP